MPLDEQRAIAHVLGTLDDKIELNRRMNETLEAMARALFRSWFVDFEPVRAKMEGRWRPGESLPGLPAHLHPLFPDRLVPSELGDIPEGWEVGTLGDVAVQRRRGVKPAEIDPADPVHRAGTHATKRSIALTEWDTAEDIESGKFAFEQGEILFGKLRPYFHKIGVAPVGGVCSTDIVVAAPVSPEWFGFVLGQMSSTGVRRLHRRRVDWHQDAPHQLENDGAVRACRAAETHCSGVCRAHPAISQPHGLRHSRVPLPRSAARHAAATAGVGWAAGRARSSVWRKYLVKLSERIDKPIVLKRTTIDILLDDGPVPARAKVVMRLSPRPRTVIEFDFPRSTHTQAVAYDASNQIQTKHYLDIEISPGTRTQTLFGGEIRIGGGEIWCGGTLIPTTQPVTAIPCVHKLSLCKFALINFPSLWGAQDIHRPISDTTGTVAQRSLLQAGPWSIEIRGVGSLMSLDDRMKRSGGSAITHAGSIRRTDGSEFALEELEVMLDALHLFLSFARGSYCGLAFLSGQDSQRRSVWKQWGSREAEPWRGPLSTWVCPIESETLSPVFDGFWQRFTDPAWTDTVSQVLRWYLRSNESSEPAVGIILTQAALERLSHAIDSQGSGKTGVRIAAALQKAGIDSNIPAQCPELTALAQQQSWSHGPHAFVDVRNALAHPTSKLGPVSASVYAEAQRLGQWYIELMLLHLFGYSGRYLNRLGHAAGHGSPIEDVPWAVKSGGSS